MTDAVKLPAESMGQRVLRSISIERSWQAIRNVVNTCLSRRELIAELTRRDIGASHAGHGLGSLWSYLQPLIIIGIYLLIFGFVIGSKIAITVTFPGDYPSYIAVGLIAWLGVQSALIKSTGALTSNSNLVKQVVFPIEVLPISSVLGALWPFWPALILVLVYKAAFGGGLPLTTLLLPIVVVMQVALCIGLAFMLSGLTCFVRDLREFVGLFCLIAMYITPAVYLPEWVPIAFQPLLYLNPFSYLTWVYQDTLFFGEILHPWSWVILFFMSILSLSYGFRLFQKLKPHYGNVL